MGINYKQWLKGSNCGCGCGNNYPTIDKCDCDAILLDISKLQTDVTALSLEKQDELIAGSGIEISDGNVISCTVTGGSGITVDAYTKEESDNRFQPIGNYATTSELIQYINNLQQQIASLQAAISGCCETPSGETIYRWLTMTGANDYWCDGTTKKSIEKQQESNDGLNWVDTGTIRSGSTVLETECVDCGYDESLGLKITLNDNSSIEIGCNDLETYESSGNTYSLIKKNDVLSRLANPSDAKSVMIGTCVGLIYYDAFSGLTNLQKVDIPSTFISNSDQTYYNGLESGLFQYTAIRSVGIEGSNADVIWNNNMTDMPTIMFKGCTALTEVELPSTFDCFYPEVFSGCTNLSSITIHSTSLPVLNALADSSYSKDALSNIGNDTFVIYVPANMVDVYKSSTEKYRNWNKYASHIQAIQ